MSQSPYIFDVTTETFDQYVLENSFHKPVLVDFWAEWCAPCKALMPVLSSITESYAGELLLAKVNCDEQAALTERFGIRSLPTVVLFKDGQPVDGFTGMQPESAIRALLEPHVSAPEEETDPAEDAATTATELLEAGDAAQAITLLQQALATEPSTPLQLLLVRALLAAGQLEDAEAALAGISDQADHQQSINGLRAGIEFARQAAALPNTAVLEQRLTDNPQDSEAAYQLAIQQLAGQDYSAALDSLLRLMQVDRAYADNSPQRTLLQVFALLGDEHPLVISYRRKLYQILY